jgi:hypothetical protein
MPWETSVAHGASKRHQARPFITKAASFMIVVAPVAWLLCTLLGLCIIVPWAVPSV